MMVLTTLALVSSHLVAAQFASVADSEGVQLPPPLSEVFDSVPRGGELNLPRNARLFIADAARGSVGQVNILLTEADDAMGIDIEDWSTAFTEGMPLELGGAGKYELTVRGYDDEDPVVLPFSASDLEDTEMPIPGAQPTVLSAERISASCGLTCRYTYAEVIVEIPPASDDTIVALYEVTLRSAEGEVLGLHKVLAPNDAGPIEVFVTPTVAQDEVVDLDVDVVVYDVAGNAAAYEQSSALIPATAAACACQRPAGTSASFFGLAVGALVFGFRRRGR